MRDRIVSLQVLRFAAAAMVVVVHASCVVRVEADGGCAFYYPSEMGAAGVDIFFVLSGFIITLTGPLASPRLSGLAFFWRRWSRVAPLFYILSAPFLVRAVVSGTFNLPQTAATFLFWPASGPRIVQPYLQPGWTLTYEMLFYSAVSLLLVGGRLRRNLIIFGLAIAAVAIARLLSDANPLRVLASPFFLEFAAGATLALLWPRLKIANPRLGLVLIGVAAASFASVVIVGLANTSFAMATLSPEHRMARIAVFGVPAVLLVAGAAMCESVARGPLIGAAAWLGDASYSIYLVNGLVAPMLSAGWFALLGRGQPAGGAIAVGVATIACGALCHVVVERPILRDLRRLRIGAAATGAQQAAQPG